MNPLLSIITVSILVVCTSSCTSSGDEENEKEARLYFENGDYRASQLVTKQLISDNPSDPEYRHLLASIYFQTGNYSSALLEWHKGDELGADVSANASMRIYAYLQAGAFEDLLNLDETRYKDGSLAELKAAKVLSRLSLDQSVDDPVDQLNTLIESHSLPSLWLAKSLVLVTEERTAEALESLASALSIDSNYTLAKSLKADILVLEEDLKMADALYSEVIEEQPWRTGDILKRAVTRMRLGDMDLAEKDIDYLRKLYPKGVSVNYAKGIIEYQRNNLEKSILNFKVAETTPDLFSGALLYLASANMSLGNSLQSEDYAQRYFSSNPEDSRGRIMLASIYLEDGKYEEVVKLLKDESGPLSEGVEFSKIYGSALVISNRVEGIQYLELTAKRLKSPDLYVMWATALHQSKKHSESNSAVHTGLSLDPMNLKLRYLNISNLIALQDLAQARRESESLVNESPSESALSVLSDVYFLAGNLNLWRKTLEQMDTKYPGSEIANLKLAKSERESGNLEAAKGYYQKILAHDETNKSAMLELYSISVAKNESEAARKYLLTAVDAHPKDIKLKNILADFYLNNNDYSSVKSLYSLVLEDVYQDPTAYGLYIRAFIEEGSFDDARFHLERYVVLMPSSAIPHYMSAKVAAVKKDEGMVFRHLEESLAIDPSFYPSVLAMAKYQLTQRDVGQLKIYSEKLRALAPLLSETKIMTAKYHEAINDYRIAATLAEEVYLADVSDRSMAYWSLVCFKEKSIECLRESKSAYEKSDVKSASILKDQAGYFLHLGDEVSSIDLYEEVILKEPQDVEVLNNLGWLYLAIDTKKSVKYASRAHEISSDSSQVLDTYAMSLVAVGDFGKSLEIIDKAIENEPNNQSFLYHKAYITSESGDVQEAIDMLKLLVDNDGGFPEKSKAELLMVKLETAM